MKFNKQSIFNPKTLIFKLTFLLIILIVGCKTEGSNPIDEEEETPSDSTVYLDSADVDLSRLYIPQELRGINFFRSTSSWFFGRSKQSDHFIVFWGRGYGDKDPGSTEVPAAYRVDIDDLLEKAETFYDLNINHLKFAETGEGKSKLDDYKMMIFIFYQTEWLATGSGYDDTIGALWVSPNTCQPVGSTIGHEIGHSFQYQVNCDLGGTHGFRYGFGGNGGNAFWEQTAQWQSFQSYPKQAFDGYDLPVYIDNYHRHICHEWMRYASYWIHYYWADKHGVDMIGKVWREAESPEDPLQAYMRITGISTSEFNDEIYDAATKFVTWDLDAIRENGANYHGVQKFASTTLEDGSYQVAYDKCPGTTGYNVIPLNVPAAGTEVATKFTGLANEPGFNQVADVKRAGWRYGYVALLESGERVYGDMNRASSSTVTFTIPEGTDKLWFVVTGAPNTYKAHPWDENEANDDQWPYKVKFTNTDILGNVHFDGTETKHDVNLTYNIKFPADAAAYSGTSVALGGDIVDLAYGFVLQPSEITASMGSSVKFFAVESDGSLNPTTTANGYGHWYDADGDVITWGADAQVFSEFDAASFTFSIGQYPGHCNSGDQYTIKQALVYTYAGGQSVQATFTFNITIE